MKTKNTLPRRTDTLSQAKDPTAIADPLERGNYSPFQGGGRRPGISIA